MTASTLAALTETDSIQTMPGKWREALRVWRTGRRGAFVLGMLCAFVLLYVGRLTINETTFADRLVAPLLLPDTNGNADAIVVLGAGVVGPCAPNLNGVRRVLLAARLWHQGRAPLFVVTGGSDGVACPVAVAMAGLARELGIPESSTQLETASQTTRENGELTAPILNRRGAHRLLLVTDRLHMRRAAGTFTQLGFDVERASVPIYEGHANNVSMLAAAARETAALTYYRMRGWLREPSPGARNSDAGQLATIAESAMKGDVRYATGPLVVFGASYAGGWTPGNIAGVPVITMGVSGQQSFEMLARFERDVVPARPRAVIIWGFINDIFRSAPQDVDAALARVRDSYTRMIELSRRNGIEPILATEVTLRPQDGWSAAVRSWVARVRGKESYQDRINRHVLSTNRWLAEVAGKERLLLLDFASTLAEDGGRRRREFVADDGSHIPAAGYTALTAYAAPVLERHFGTTDSDR